MTRERDELDDGAGLLDKVRALCKSNDKLRVLVDELLVLAEHGGNNKLKRLATIRAAQEGK